MKKSVKKLTKKELKTIKGGSTVLKTIHDTAGGVPRNVI